MNLSISHSTNSGVNSSAKAKPVPPIIGLYREFAKDHKNILDKVQAGNLYCIGAEHNGKLYKILNVSEFNATIDSHKKFLLVSGRAMQDAALFYLGCCKDLMINLRVMSTKSRSFLIEPRLEAVTWNAKKMGLSNRKQLADLILCGGLGELLTADAATIRKKHQAALKIEFKRSANEEFYNLEILESELANIRARELAILYELGNEAVLASKLKDDRIRWQDSRISELRQFIINKGMQVPAPASPQGKKYMLKPR